MNLSLFDDNTLPEPEPLLRVYPVIDYSVRALCLKACPGAKKGCMNFGKRETCPPHAPLFDKYFDLSAPVYAVINTFDLAAQGARMAEMHPEWSKKKCRCSRYWQKGARKVLISKMGAVLAELPGYEGTWCPEGMGVHVTETVKRDLGIEIWPVTDIVRQIGFLGKVLRSA